MFSQQLGVSPKCLLGSAVFAREEYDLLEVIMLCLDDAKPGSSEGTLGMLEVLLSSRIDAGKKLQALEADYDIMVTEDFDERTSAMCNLSEGVFEQGRVAGIAAGHEQGLKQGRAEGIATGRAEGRAEGQAEGRAEERKATLDKVAALVRAGSLSLSDAMATFQVSEKELLERLKDE